MKLYRFYIHHVPDKDNLYDSRGNIEQVVELFEDDDEFNAYISNLDTADACSAILSYDYEEIQPSFFDKAYTRDIINHMSLATFQNFILATTSGRI